MKEPWKLVMKQLKLNHIRASAPAFFAASGGYTMDVKSYTDKTSNGLTRSIIDFLTFNGHYANRISTQGQARVHKIPRYNIFSGREYTIEKITWTEGSTRRGSPDIDAIINGRPVKIEVKVGSDYMKTRQKEERSKIELAGGVYYIARDMPSFMEWYETKFVNQCEIK